MARLMVTGLMAISVMITGCQNQKFGSEPAQSTAKPSASPPPSGVPPRNPPPGNGAPPPGVGPQAPPPGVGPQAPPPGVGPGPGFGPGPGAGGVVPPPPPGNGNGGTPPPPPPGMGTPPPPPPPGNGNQPPPGNGSQPPPGNGNGPTIIPTGPPPGNGNGGVPPSTGNGPSPSPGPTVVVQPPTTTPPTTTTVPPTVTNNPPTVTNNPQPQPPAQQPLPPVQTLPPIQQTVPASNLPPQNYPQAPKPCTGLGCPGQQVVPPPAPVVPIAKPTPPPPAPAPAAPRPTQPTPPPAKPTVPFEQPAQPTPIVQQPAPKPECEDQPLDTKLDTTKLDLLFVFDTSASMRNGKRTGMTGELGMIAKQIGSFVKNLDESTDFRIGMMLGHGPENAKHPGYKHGTLFQVSSSDPAVIDFSKELKACGKVKDARKCAVERVTAALEKKIRSLPTDHSDAQGEAINLSLYDMATNDELRRGIKEQGLLRKGAMLNIIPISDEQDVCYSDVDTSTGMYTQCKQFDGESEDAYKQRCTPAQVKIKDAKGKVIGTGADPHETNFYRDYCARAVNGNPLTVEHVYTALKNLQEDGLARLAVTPIVYWDNNVPRAEQDENEMGHGHLDLAQMTGGKPANLASARNAAGESNFTEILTQLGQFVTTKMTFATPFMCSSTMDPMAMDLNALDIHILDQKGRDLQIFKPQCTEEPCVSPGVAVIGMDSDGSHRHVIIKVDETQMSNALKARGFTDGKARIKFTQRSDYNADGTRKNIFGVSARRSAKLKRTQAQDQTAGQAPPPPPEEQHAEGGTALDLMPTSL